MGQSFKELLVWQRAVQLSVAVYGLTASFPASERFGLTNQMRRAAVSVASNIAEGYGRSSRREFIQFLGHARGSNCELQTQLVISSALGFGTEQSHRQTDDLSREVNKMLVPMMSKLIPIPCSLLYCTCFARPSFSA